VIGVSGLDRTNAPSRVRCKLTGYPRDFFPPKKSLPATTDCKTTNASLLASRARLTAIGGTRNLEIGLAVQCVAAYNLPPPSERHGRLSLLTGDPDLSCDTRST